MKKIIVQFSAQYGGEIELEVSDNATEEEVDDKLHKCTSAELFAAAQTDLALAIELIDDSDD